MVNDLGVMYDRSGDGVVVQAADGRIVDCNTAAERILGRTRDDLLGRTSRDTDWSAVHLDGSPFAGDLHPAMMALRTGLPVRDVLMGIGRPQGRAWILVNA